MGGNSPGCKSLGGGSSHWECFLNIKSIKSNNLQFWQNISKMNSFAGIFKDYAYFSGIPISRSTFH